MSRSYREYIDNKVFAEECDFDWIGRNEHHMSPYGLMPNPNLTAAAVLETMRHLRDHVFPAVRDV